MNYPSNRDDQNSDRPRRPNTSSDRYNDSSRGPRKIEGRFNSSPRFRPEGRPSRGDSAPSDSERSSFDDGINPIVKKLRKLHTDKGRMEASEFLVEGPKAVEDILAIDPSIIEEVYLSDKHEEQELVEHLRASRVRMTVMTEREIERVSQTQTPQGIVARARFATLRPDYARIHRITILDGIQDPGNLGAIFRSSLALGMDALILGKGCCEAYNPKVVRASVGYVLRVPFEAGVDLESKITFLRQKGFTIVSTSSHSAYTLDQIKLRRKVALILGNEGAGVQEKFSAMADSVVRIPLVNQTESLNVSVAHGILCHVLRTSAPAL